MNSKVSVNVHSKKISPYKKLGIATQELINNCRFEDAKEMCFKAVSIQDTDMIDSIIDEYASFNLVDQDLDNMTFREVLERCPTANFLFMGQYNYISINNNEAHALTETDSERQLSFDGVIERSAKEYLDMTLTQCQWADDEQNCLFAHAAFPSQTEDIDESEDESFEQTM